MIKRGRNNSCVVYYSKCDCDKDNPEIWWLTTASTYFLLMLYFVSCGSAAALLDMSSSWRTQVEGAALPGTCHSQGRMESKGAAGNPATFLHGPGVCLVGLDACAQSKPHSNLMVKGRKVCSSHRESLLIRWYSGYLLLCSKSPNTLQLKQLPFYDTWWFYGSGTRAGLSRAVVLQQVVWTRSLCSIQVAGGLVWRVQPDCTGLAPW